MVLDAAMTLRDYLTKHNLSLGNFAQRIGVTREAVRLWARKARTPRNAQMVAIMRATNGEVTAQELLGILPDAQQDQENDGAPRV
jgi:DNA-binding transcriptional regulator YdaS (Cro superfamily)